MSEHPVFDPTNLRVDYVQGKLTESDAADDPIEQFRQWFAAAGHAKIKEPNAMTLATADADGVPSARIVLLKAFDEQGFVFYTNYDSAKAHDLAANPRAALVFFWDVLERQVRVQGIVRKVTAEETNHYFATRPRKSQLGAWVSAQSEPIASRAVLESTLLELEQRFDGQEIPPPPRWGGYRLVPAEIEFWQGRRSRLHDRLQYTREGQGSWSLQRLSP